MILRKLKQYFEAGVKEAWLVDPESSPAQLWTGPSLPDHELTRNDAIATPLLPGLKLPLDELFS
jgi:Uma2 family endonuclease